MKDTKMSVSTAKDARTATNLENCNIVFYRSPRKLVDLCGRIISFYYNSAGNECCPQKFQISRCLFFQRPLRPTVRVGPVVGIGGCLELREVNQLVGMVNRRSRFDRPDEQQIIDHGLHQFGTQSVGFV